MRFRFLSRTIALVAVLAMVGAACGGDDEGGVTPTTPAEQPRSGGELVVAAEQWPECISPITSCSGATWTWFSVLQQVLPQAMAADVQGNFFATPVLDEAPTGDNGGVTQDPFTVTFRISEAAVWEDGSPITSEDIEFTWLAITNTPGAYTTAGYSSIEAVDTTDPKVAVIKFKDVYVDWPDLFGGTYQGIFKKAAFPDADAEKPNLEQDMLDNIPFSGGPWVLDSWSPDQAVFSRNENYFGPKAYLDKVTFVPRTDQATEINSLLTGEVAAIYPQPSNVSLIDQLGVNPNVTVKGFDGAYFEALWFNNTKPPLDDIQVREALMYAIDRQSVIDNLIKLNNPNGEVLNCGFVSFPHIGPWCSTPYFEEFSFQPEKSIELLEGAGYDCSGVPDSPCTKDGEPLVIQYSTVAGNARRETTQELLKESVKQAGFEFEIKNHEAGVLFGDVGPKGDFVMAEWATGGTVDPTPTSQFACDSIPTEENQFGGSNWIRWCNEDATALMKQSDQELDATARLDLLNQVYQMEEDERISLPLYILPNVAAWRTDKVAGPIDKWATTNYGIFYNLHEWFIPAAAG
jgi:peptide/nickel transport system substrate-binding protein